MGATILFIAILAAIAAWWLSRQRLTAKPWLEAGAIGEMPGTGAIPLAAARIGLGVFLAVVGSLFALLVGAYLMRMQHADWLPVPKPGLLWVNTGVLILRSGALVWAQDAAARQDAAALRAGILVAAGAAGAFLVGQVAAWREIAAGGYFFAANPATTFFYLITGLHGLHLAGGLLALADVAHRAWTGGDPERLGLRLDLCALYWHFLLLAWCLLFSLLLLT
jgi:cytochrome c oxidase subunit 3